MAWSIALQTGCHTIFVPGWAAVFIAVTLAAPRVADRLLEKRGK